MGIPTLIETACAIKTRRLQSIATEQETTDGGHITVRDVLVAHLLMELVGRHQSRSVPRGLKAPTKPTPEIEVTPRKPCLVHKEKTFTFSDGTVWRACSHDLCGWGKMHGFTNSHTVGLFSQEID